MQETSTTLEDFLKLMRGKNLEVIDNPKDYINNLAIQRQAQIEQESSARSTATGGHTG